jgi:hypothetical protein
MGRLKPVMRYVALLLRGLRGFADACNFKKIFRFLKNSGGSSYAKSSNGCCILALIPNPSGRREQDSKSIPREGYLVSDKIALCPEGCGNSIAHF